MKNHTIITISITLLFAIMACSIFTPNSTRLTSTPEITDLKSESDEEILPPTPKITDSDGETLPAEPEIIDTDMVIIKTNDPSYGIVLSHKNGEALIISTETGTDGNIANVTGAIWISPNGEAITVYFEGGLPTHAVIDENLVLFEYNNDNTVNITIIAPDGSKSNQPNVPIDIEPIPEIKTNSKHDIGSPHLAHLTMQYIEMTTKDWAREVSIAFGVFSCTITFGSGGTLSILTGAGCAATIYTMWSTSQEEEIPVLDKASTGLSAVQCGLGITRKDPMSVADCASGLIDVGINIFGESDTVVSKNEANSPQDQILGMWVGEFVWSCDPPAWSMILEFFPNKVSKSSARDGETGSSVGIWTLSGNSITIQWPTIDNYTNTYYGVVSGDSIEGTADGAGPGCDGTWSATKE